MRERRARQAAPSTIILSRSSATNQSVQAPCWQSWFFRWSFKTPAHFPPFLRVACSQDSHLIFQSMRRISLCPREIMAPTSHSIDDGYRRAVLGHKHYTHRFAPVLLFPNKSTCSPDYPGGYQLSGPGPKETCLHWLRSWDLKRIEMTRYVA